jgi:hypothetical protein
MKAACSSDLGKSVIVFLLLLIGPIAVSAAKYLLGDRSGDWQTADRSSAGLLPPAAGHPEALVRVYAARTVRWRGIFAVHSWIVIKERNAPRYTRYDYTAWGEPIRINGFVADGRWFGGAPETIAAADGEAADRMIPKIRAAVEGYQLRAYGDYRAWPEPNSNTFVTERAGGGAGIADHTAADRHRQGLSLQWRHVGPTPSGTVPLTLGGYLGLTIGWVEGIEINFSARCSASICVGRRSNCRDWDASVSAIDGLTALSSPIGHWLRNPDRPKT